ncbi:hypothetical protein BLNAU_20588 [Blattamonas nauphoetae]|uniref:Uncharacterized protein n=1 Tax=Blattamonas nauphoetae TaxID=2049346 RepID=A0ABQ9WY97_9EUKA|nr:hypothetical protein BLNAU_20588 [Blattamonas nauphoetae]
MESLFFEPEFVDSLFLRHKDFILSAFTNVGESTPPSAVVTTLARISLFPHLRIADPSLMTLCAVLARDPSAFTLLPSPIFPLSSPHQPFSGISFLVALTKKLRIAFSEVQNLIPADPSHLPKYVQIMNDDPDIFSRFLNFCYDAFLLPLFLLEATPPLEVDSEIIRELILFVKEALPTILTNISTIDTLIASLPSDSSATTPLISLVAKQMTDALTELRNGFEVIVGNGWGFFINMTYKNTDPHKSSFQAIILDDPSFPDLVLNSLKLTLKGIKENILIAVSNIILYFPSMKTNFMKENFVRKMFETVDFVSLPLSESSTLFHLTRFITSMFTPIGNDDQACFEQFPLIRVFVFEPAKQFIKFIFHNSDKLVLDEQERTHFEKQLCWIHIHINNMEIRSDEHDADIVSERMNWETRAMNEMENKVHFKNLFRSMLSRTREWRQNKPDRQKRRELLLREEGWDDGLELRMIGMGVDTEQEMKDFASLFSVELAFNVDNL